MILKRGSYARLLPQPGSLNKAPAQPAVAPKRRKRLSSSLSKLPDVPPSLSAAGPQTPTRQEVARKGLKHVSSPSPSQRLKSSVKVIRPSLPEKSSPRRTRNESPASPSTYYQV